MKKIALLVLLLLLLVTSQTVYAKRQSKKFPIRTIGVYEVYICETGKCYHNTPYHCKKGATCVSKKMAESLRLTPCKHCYY